MKECPSCVKPLADNAITCPACGFSFVPDAARAAASDDTVFGFGVLGCFLPIVGFVLYVLWKDESPKKANACGVGACFGITGIPLYVIGGLFVIILLLFGHMPFE